MLNGSSNKPIGVLNGTSLRVNTCLKRAQRSTVLKLFANGVMVKRYFLDTSFISSLLNPDDVNHSAARAHYDLFVEEDELWVSPIVLIELLLLTKQVKGLSWTLLHDLVIVFNIETVTFDYKYINQLAEFITNTELFLKPNDYAILASTHLLKANLLTFDEKLLAVSEKTNGKTRL